MHMQSLRIRTIFPAFSGRFARARAKSYSHSVSPRALAGDLDSAFSKT
jgi:hypothetical protein